MDVVFPHTTHAARPWILPAPGGAPGLDKAHRRAPPGSPLRAPTQNPDLTHSRDVDKVQGADVTCALLIPKAAYTGILRKLRYKM